MTLLITITENLLRDEIDKREAALTERNLANARAQLLREQLADVTPVRAPNGQFVSRAA